MTNYNSYSIGRCYFQIFKFVLILLFFAYVGGASLDAIIYEGFALWLLALNVLCCMGIYVSAMKILKFKYILQYKHLTKNL